MLSINRIYTGRRRVPRPARSLHRGRPARQREPRGGGAPPHPASAHGAAPNARGRPGDRPLRAQPPRYGAHRRRPGPTPVRAARDRADARRAQGGRAAADGEGRRAPHRRRARGQYVPTAGAAQVVPVEDRKSTRLNSSHGYISYAVFCLKKKKKKETDKHAYISYANICFKKLTPRLPALHHNSNPNENRTLIRSKETHNIHRYDHITDAT